MKPLIDLLPAFVFVAVFAWLDAGATGKATGPGAQVAGALLSDPAGMPQAPVLVATLVALAVLVVHAAALRWRPAGRGWTQPARRSLAAMLALLALLALTASFMGGSPAPSPWLPSALYWTLGLALWLARVVLQRNLLRTLLEHRIAASDLTWQRLNAAWVGFFGLLGLLHLWVSYNVSLQVGLLFNVGGGLALSLLFLSGQRAYVLRQRRGGGLAQASPTALGRGGS